MNRPGNSNSDLNVFFENPIISVKIVDKDDLIARLTAQIATLHDYRLENVSNPGKSIIFDSRATRSEIDHHLIYLMNINHHLLKSCKGLLALIRSKKCCDYWDEVHLSRAQMAIELAERKTKKEKNHVNTK